MPKHNGLNPAIVRLAGLAAILSGLLFFVGVWLQFTSGWFPEEALRSREMESWLNNVTETRITALAGIGFSSVAIMLWAVVGLVLYRLLGNEQPALALVGLTGYLTGIPLALVAFVFGFGITWGLTDAASTTNVVLSTALMRSFLVMDDIATFLIGGVGNGFFSLAALRSDRMPKWLTGLGILAALLVTVVLLRYTIPVFEIATFGYPLVLAWFVLVGIVLVRKSRNEAVIVSKPESV